MNSKITKVEIVHGIGEGILRNEVHQILKNYKLRYYLSKNGGSTEVML
jgi:dsDNA-specific endonuclease/ATPase MutS2